MINRGASYPDNEVLLREKGTKKGGGGDKRGYTKGTDGRGEGAWSTRSPGLIRERKANRRGAQKDTNEEKKKKGHWKPQGEATPRAGDETEVGVAGRKGKTPQVAISYQGEKKTGIRAT